MAKKKAAGKLSAGDTVRAKPGVTAPEFPDVSCEGWTGHIADLIGKKSDPKYVIEWDDDVVKAMPESYVKKCEETHLFYHMACFKGDEIERVEE